MNYETASAEAQVPGALGVVTRARVSSGAGAIGRFLPPYAGRGRGERAGVLTGAELGVRVRP
jgi:hypothetical protein